MTLTVTLEQRFDVTPDGRAWVQFGYGHAYWQHYLELFSQVRIAARAQLAQEPPPGHLEVTGPSVSFVALPYYLGPTQYLKQYSSFRRSAAALADEPGAFLFRAPTMISAPCAAALNGRPYGVLVVGDPEESAKAVQHWASRIFGAFVVNELKKTLCGAAAVAYVTREALQRKYPPGPDAYSTWFSDVRLTEQSFACAAKQFNGGPARVVFVGSLEALYKGQEDLLNASAPLIRDNLISELVMVGGGRYMGHLQGLADQLGISKRVTFTGMLTTPEKVREELDRADLFILPSHTEGLPRALVEAMARGLPSMASRVGGIPELIDESCLITPREPAQLEHRMRALLGNFELMNRAAAENLERSKAYRWELQRAKEMAFLKEIHDRTAGS